MDGERGVVIRYRLVEDEDHSYLPELIRAERIGGRLDLYAITTKYESGFRTEQAAVDAARRAAAEYMRSKFPPNTKWTLLPWDARGE